MVQKLKNLVFLGLCATALVVPATGSAQSVRHDFMDAHAAQRDLARLLAERAEARREHNWGKVRQDNRLIAADRHFIRKDRRKIINATGIPPR